MKWLARFGVLAVIVGVAVALASCGPKSAAAQLDPRQRLTAREAWEIIEPDAERWKSGSLIILGRPPSRPGREDLALDGRSSAWRFIAAPEGDTFPGIYTLDTTISPIQVNRTEQRRPVAQAYVDPAEWQVDSDEALAIAEASGLEAWLADNPDFQVRVLTLELNATVAEGAFWRIAAQQGASSIELHISAIDGAVLSVTP